MSYNPYQKMHYEAQFGKPIEKPKEKQYALYENGVPGYPAPYSHLQTEKQKRIANGVPAYLLKIKPYTLKNKQDGK